MLGSDVVEILNSSLPHDYSFGGSSGGTPETFSFNSELNYETCHIPNHGLQEAYDGTVSSPLPTLSTPAAFGEHALSFGTPTKCHTSLLGWGHPSPTDDSAYSIMGAPSIPLAPVSLLAEGCPSSFIGHCSISPTPGGVLPEGHLSSQPSAVNSCQGSPRRESHVAHGPWNGNKAMPLEPHVAAKLPKFNVTAAAKQSVSAAVILLNQLELGESWNKKYAVVFSAFNKRWWLLVHMDASMDLTKALEDHFKLAPKEEDNNIEKLYSYSKRERKEFPLERRLRHRIVGQQATIASIAKQIRRKENGWCSHECPLTILMMGCSGSGKTLLAKQLAAYLHEGNKAGFIRLDMAEYQQRHEVWTPCAPGAHRPFGLHCRLPRAWRFVSMSSNNAPHMQCCA